MKRKLLFVSASLAISLCAFAQIPTTGLVRHYPFTGNVNDYTANAKNGLAYNISLANDRFGNSNSAYSFNGTTSSYISIPATGLNLNEYTYSAWVSLSATPMSGDRSWVISIGSLTGTNNYEQFLNYNNTYGGTPPANGWGGGGYNVTSPNGFAYQGTTGPINQWNHIVVTRSATESKIYVNGLLMNTTTFTSTNTPNYGTGTLEASIGKRRSDSNPFKGKIDDIRIYNRPLAQSEITQLYNETSDNLGVDSAIYASLKVYPNPSSGRITIDLGGNTELTGGYIKVLNILGQQVFTDTITQQTTSIDLSKIVTTDTFFVHIFDKNQKAVSVKKIIFN